MRLKAHATALAAIALLTAAPIAMAMTRSQARAIARDVNLKTSDMAGWDSAPSSTTARDRQIDAQLARCAGGVPLSRALADVTSPAFVKGDSTAVALIGSEVAVFRKPALVQKELRAWRTTRARECLRALILQGAESTGGSATVTATTLQTAVKGVFGFRFRTDASSSGSPTTVYSDILFMGKRSAEARVIVNSAPDPPTQSDEDRVVRIVKTRLDARLDPNTLL